MMPIGEMAERLKAPVLKFRKRPNLPHLFVGVSVTEFDGDGCKLTV
jgi:hypothetical protein